MRVKALKRWVILVAVLSVIGGTGVFSQRLQLTRLAKSVADQADSAVKEGDFGKAERLYWEHLVVFPNDTEIQIKYADSILKAAPLPKRQAEALQIYSGILTRHPGRDDVRRKQMMLKIAMGQLRDQGAEVDLQILLNMDSNKNDGNLLFLMGRCCEDGKNDLDAAMWYRRAIENNAPQQIEAYQRLATLLRGQLNEPADADKTVEEMVRSAPKNYLVYLARGRYRRQFGLPEGEADFQKALELAADSPDVYLEIAGGAETQSGYETARQVLEVGLTKAPTSERIYEALATLELRTGRTEQAVKTLERGLKSAAAKSNLLWILANVLAVSGDTAKLRLQIEELRKIGYPQVLIQFLEAYYYINSNEFRKARQILVPLESIVGLGADLKARVSDMLARCYSQLGEPGMQQEAYLRALRTNPQDITAKLGLIANMVSQGEIDGAIKEYRLLAKRAPQVRLPLARLLIVRNGQRPAAHRDWTEAESLISAVEKSSPESVEIAAVRADFYMAQQRVVEARDELEKAKKRFPKSVVVWGAQAGLLGLQKQFDEAKRVLDQARDLLGDRVELRLQRARLSATKGGPQVVKDLKELGQNLESFSREDRRALLNGLALELMRQQALQDAIQLWSQLAEQEPNDLELRLTLLDLAFQTANSDEIDKNIKQIEQIEGSEGLLGRYCQVRYLIWRAQREPQEALRRRAEARILLNELASRRADWSMIPLALAELEQQELQELAKSNPNPSEIQAKEESIIRSYRRAIDLGQRGSAVVRRTVQLLFKNKRGSEALDLLNSIPVESQLAGDLGRQASKFAVESRDFERAEAIARQIVTANPADFQERIWLVRILLASGRQDNAETELYQAVRLVKNDPDRWITLVQFMVLTKQPEKAVMAIKEAEKSLSSSEVPLALAQCCELLGGSYERNNKQASKKWYTEAKTWFEQARAARPNDLSIIRRLTDFFRRTNQMAEAEAQLNSILKGSGRPEDADTVAWARRTLALTLAFSNDIRRVRSALSLLEPTGNQSTNALDDPEDTRALVRVLEAQGTDQHRKRAIELLESLIGRGLANAEDRFLIAQLHERNGDWPKAREEYRDLNLRTKNSRDLQTLNRRGLYLAQFVSGLIRNHHGGDDQDLTEAQLLVDELKQLQPDPLGVLALEVDIHRARNELDKAANLIQIFANRPDLTPHAIGSLAQQAEKLERFDIAEQLYRRYAAVPDAQDRQFILALFLGRHSRVKEALDLCEPLWVDSRNVEKVAGVCIEVILASSAKPDPVQLNRVTGWLEQAIEQGNSSAVLLLALGNCRERQERYDAAKTLYENITKQSTPNLPLSSGANNTTAMAYNNLAWLLALEGDHGKDALMDINRAIRLVGSLPEYLDTRGVVYLSLKRPKDAIDDLEIAVKADPSASKLFHLTQAYLQANNREKAKQCWKSALDKKLDQVRLGPNGLHPLEQPIYQKVFSELGSP